MRRAAFALLMSLGLGAAGEARSASRTIQFAGLASSSAQVADIINKNSYATCQVVLVNTGGTSQKVQSFSVLNYSSDTETTSGAAWAAPDHQAMRTSNAADFGDACINKSIPEGGICIFQWKTMTVPLDERYIVCSGRFSVIDENATQPGSMIAAGSASVFQESRVMGGVLSGAYYASGTHRLGNPVVNVAYDPNFLAPPNSHNMNFYCAQSCVTAGGAADFCEQHCGNHGSTHDPSSGGEHVINLFTESSPSISASLLPSPDASQSVVRAANSHFAFGMVYELAIGPLASICSGNTAYWDLGGQEWEHSDSIDSFVKAKGLAPGGPWPPERLICNHRHAASDLYSSVGTTSPFPVNGGLPF